MDPVLDSFKEHIKVVKNGLDTHAELIRLIGKHLSNALLNDGVIYWCGNGGSAADSQHLAAELIGRFKNNRQALASIALSTDTSVLTCVANDYSYEEVFSRQIQGLGKAQDVLVGISTSGNSKNILNALKTAKSKGMTTIAFLGKDGGAAKEIADFSLVVESDSTARIQEFHIIVGHILCEIIETELGYI